ncbi:MAG: cadmium-translocating P-type ATPase [Clostridia bacterium]|nr:cadmium-translocating P-type ATPase [Clostridia bacterium]
MTKKQKKLLIRILIATALFLPLFILDKLGFVEDWPWYIAFPLFLIPYLIAGYSVLWKAVRNIGHGQIFDENFLMCVATVGVFVMAIVFGDGEYPEACMVMLLYQTGELLQGIAVGKSRKSVAGLMDIRPDYANLVRDEGTERVSPEEVPVGGLIVVKPGEKIPLDGIVREGRSNLDTAALTGESLPRPVGEGDEIVSGCINMNGLLTVEVTKTYGESTVSKILDLVENASAAKAKSENFITRFAKYYTPVVVGAALLLALIPPLAFGQDWTRWIKLALTCLVVSCPCALVISVPLTFFGGIGGAARRGILIKGSNWLEVLSRVRTVAFDKTGTLTKGSFRVTVIHPDMLSERELLYYAAAAENYSDHPISLSLKQAYHQEIDRSRISDVEEIPGYGIRAKVDGKAILVGSDVWMDVNKIRWHTCSEHTGTVIHVALEGKYAGHVEIEDELKPDSASAIQRLKPRKTVLLTGDQSEAGERVKAALGMDECYCGLLPENKVTIVEQLLSDPDNRALAFVGDGINDAPVLSRADLGIAMGALGSDAAVEAADVVLMDDKPSKVALAVHTARKTMRIVWENVIFSLAVKFAVLILEILLTLQTSSPLAAYAMPLAAFADVGVLILAVLNATRALRVRDPEAS